MGIVSGIPTIKNGVQIGATDFSEFAVGSGVPFGITQFGSGSDAPTTMAIENDAVEGNFFSMTGQGIQAWAFGYDAFFGRIDTGELLVRFFSNYNANTRRNIGGVASLSGLIAQPEPNPDLDFWGGNLFLTTDTPDTESSGVTSDDGSGAQPLQGALIQEPFQNMVWAWMRVRRVPNSGDPTRDDWTGTTWYGAIGDEPVAPDGTALNIVRVISGLAAIGWGVSQFGDVNKQQIAFMSYSGDPSVEAPPVPSEIDDPWAPAGNQLPIVTAWTPAA